MCMPNFVTAYRDLWEKLGPPFMVTQGHRLWQIDQVPVTSYWWSIVPIPRDKVISVKRCKCFLPPCVEHVIIGVGLKKLEWMLMLLRSEKQCDSVPNHFVRIQALDGQTDRNEISISCRHHADTKYDSTEVPPGKSDYNAWKLEWCPTRW